MLEILAVYMLSAKLRRMAMGKGLSQGWGALALVWFGGEFMVAILAAAAGVRGAGVYGAAILGAAVGAWSAYLVVNSLAPAPGWSPDMRWAGYCRKCKTNVWMTADLSKCQNGHPAAQVKNLYLPPGQGGGVGGAEPVRAAL